MKLVNGIATFILGYVTVAALTFTGQDNLNQAEMITTSYSDKTKEVVKSLKALKEENAELKANIATLTEELDESKKSEEINELIQQLETLQKEYDDLLTEYDALVIAHGEADLADQAHQAEVHKANAEIEKANKATEDHLNAVENILDEQVFDGLLDEE